MRTAEQIDKILKNDNSTLVLLEITHFRNLRAYKYITDSIIDKDGGKKDIITTYKTLETAIKDIEYRYGGQWEYDMSVDRVVTTTNYNLRHTEIAPMQFKPEIRKRQVQNEDRI